MKTHLKIYTYTNSLTHKYTLFYYNFSFHHRPENVSVNVLLAPHYTNLSVAEDRTEGYVSLTLRDFSHHMSKKEKQERWFVLCQ